MYIYICICMHKCTCIYIYMYTYDFINIIMDGSKHRCLLQDLRHGESGPSAVQSRVRRREGRERRVGEVNQRWGFP